VGKATVVSFIQRPIVQPVPGCAPASYTVPGAESIDRPAVLVIEDAEGFKFIGFEVGIGVNDGTIRNLIPALDIARGIATTHISAQIFTEFSSGCVPGIFAVEGEWTAEQVRDTFTSLYKENQQNQIRYYEKLISEGDDAWTRFRQHRFIADNQREAARIMGQKREWAQRVNTIKIDCPGCGEFVDPTKAVCRHCGCIINKEAYSNLEFAGGAPSVKPALAVAK